MKGWEIRTAGEVSCGSKTKQAYELIKQKILMLEFAPGQPLRELELSERFSMSRTPIRAAIERLVADCFVEETAGKRTIVSGVSVDGFIELYEIREALEMLCVSLAAYAWQDHREIEQARELIQRQFELARQTPGGLSGCTGGGSRFSPGAGSYVRQQAAGTGNGVDL